MVYGVKTYYGRYAYDEAGQLVREDNRRAGKTYVYVYDIGGNIVSKTEYDYTEGDITAEMTPTDTKTFGYSHGTWNDVLTSYNGAPVAYDAMGNITSFDGDTYEWTAGRQLKKMTESDGDFFLYYYNESGFLLRYEAYAADGTYKGGISYYWDGDRLLGCKIVDAPTEDTTGSEFPVRIMYDSDGEAVGILLGDAAPVYYGKNLQGDITALYDHEGNYIVGYIYDAYGNIVNFDIPTDESLSTGEQIGKMVVAFFYASFNPLSYSGYLYAPAIGLSYYLGSRFYCPAICRFLNADVYADTGTGAAGTNMFAYCNNNPVMFTDPDGHEIFFSKTNLVMQLMSALYIVLYLKPKVGISAAKMQELSSCISNYQHICYVLFVMLNGKLKGNLNNANYKKFIPKDSKGSDLTGNQIPVVKSFLIKKVCKLIAPYYLWIGDTELQIAKEIFFHAAFHYMKGSDIESFLISLVGQNKINEYYDRADPINLGGDSFLRKRLFSALWNFWGGIESV